MSRGVASPVPELDGHPLLGHLPVFHRDRLELLDACAASPGDVVQLRIGRPAYLLKRAEDVHHVLVTHHDAYPKGARNIGTRARRIFGTGLMTSTAEVHRQMRVRAQPAFRRDPVSRLEKGLLRSVDAMLDRWRDRDEIDLADEMNALALQSLIGAIFGVDSGSRFAAIEDGLMARRLSMGRAFAWPVTAPGFLPIALRPSERQAIRRLDQTVAELIQERRDGAAASDDLLSMMIERHEGGRSASDPRQIRDETLNLALAAHGNVARALTYTLLAIARHPHVEESVGAEVDQVVGAREPVAGDRDGLRYTEMTLAESMRLWPPSALVFRAARQDDVLPTGTRVRAGSKILLSPYVVHRDAAYYPDPLRFDPERFSEEGRRGRPKYAYFPFGGGPRVCIGQTLSSTLCTLALARMAQRVRLELAGDTPRYACGCLEPGYGPRMRVQARVRSLV
jgi:cytochrome P450